MQIALALSTVFLYSITCTRNLVRPNLAHAGITGTYWLTLARAGSFTWLKEYYGREKRRNTRGGEGQGPRGRTGADRKAVRQRVGHAHGRQRPDRRSAGRLDRLARPGHRAGRRRLAARPGGGNLRT